jgi:uncharacterized protein YecE (DUF72 family)
MPRRIFIGTAGWSIPRASAHRFDDEGTHLERYARVFAGVEINSSFHRPHATSTYAKWAAATPDNFLFAIKTPRVITHDHQLRRIRLPLERFLAEIGGLDDKQGPLLVQLPPALVFDARVAARFFDNVRARYDGFIVCEPRHPTWFTARVDALFVRYHVARAAADPPPAAAAGTPGGWRGLVYFRLHGSPRKYWSRYDGEYVSALATAIREVPRSVDAWCVFDNTASGAALENAWELETLLRRQRIADEPSSVENSPMHSNTRIGTLR